MPETASKPYQGASLFDLDKTLLTVNCSYRFGVYLYKKKYLSLFSMLYLLGCYSLHKLGLLSMQSLHTKVFENFFKGRHAETIKKMAADFINETFDTFLYSPAVHKLRLAQSAGHFTSILSSSPDFLVKLFAQRFNVDEAYSTHYIVGNHEKFMEINNVLIGDLKARYVNELIIKLGIPRSQISAYSDSILDLSFLETAGIPVGVNPDKELRAICLKNEWEII